MINNALGKQKLFEAKIKVIAIPESNGTVYRM